MVFQHRETFPPITVLLTRRILSKRPMTKTRHCKSPDVRHIHDRPDDHVCNKNGIVAHMIVGAVGGG